MATDKNLQNLIINKLTKEQYDAIDSPSPDELYLIPDEIDDTPTQGSDNPVKSGGVFAALSGKQNTIDAQHKLDYSLIANTPAIPPADYVAMIDITSSTGGNGNLQYTGTIVSGTFAEIDAALLAQKTVLVVGRYPTTNPVSYQYFRSGYHMPTAEIVFTSTGGEMISGAVTAATWYPAANGEPERVLVGDGTGIIDVYPMGDGNAVTSIEKSPLFPFAIVNKDKTFVDTAEQTLTEAQKSQARTNIGAGTYSKPANGIPASDLADGVIPTIPTDMVKYTAQTLTDAQKAQARTNIGATEIFWVNYDEGATPKATKTWSDIADALSHDKIVLLVEDFYTYSCLGYSATDYCIVFGAVIENKIRYFKVSINDEWTYTETAIEPASNKVTSWQNTPDNDHYPSEKLVKDSLDGKQPTIDANHKLDYSLVSNTPTIPAAPVNADWNASSGLAQILNKPSIPAAQVNADWDAVSGVAQILNKPTIPFPKIYIGTCTTAAATAAKTATVETFPLDANNKPLVGTVVGIKFSNTNSAGSATLNVNSTGAASIWYDAAEYTGSGSYAGAASRYLYFVWDGTYWAFLSWGYDKDADTNTVGYNLRINGLALPFESKTYRYRLMFASPDNKTLVPANTSSSTSSTASKTVNQDKINPFGIIWYYSYTSAISAGSTTTAARLWYQYGGIVLGYSFNNTGAALTMTEKDPIYLKCAPQTDGSAIMDSTAPIVHALPSAADGKIYILLGYAESETAMTLIANHPVYYHDGTSVRLWTGIGIDTTPTQDSTNLVTSGGVYTAIQNAGGGGGSETDEYLSKYFTIEALSSGTIEWRTIASMLIGVARVSYRINGGTWVEDVYPYKSSTNADSVIFVSQGDRVEFKGTNTSIGTHMPTNRSYFAGTARFKVYGNIMSLIGGDNFVGLKELPHETASEKRTFAGLFQDNTGIVDASNLRLPATTLSDYCYYQMFKGCTSLISAPTLPATTLTSQCYYGMFDGCIALTNAPALLATTLASSCYSYMFRGCTALTDAPSLRAVTLASSCYNYMFYGCTNLNYVIALFTDTPGSNYTKDWLDGVSATGTFVKNSSATWDVSGSSGIPSGWTVETTSR